MYNPLYPTVCDLTERASLKLVALRLLELLFGRCHVIVHVVREAGRLVHAMALHGDDVSKLDKELIQRVDLGRDRLERSRPLFYQLIVERHRMLGRLVPFGHRQDCSNARSTHRRRHI